MYKIKPSSSFICLTIILLLTLNSLTIVYSNEEDIDDIDELIALDEEEDSNQQNQNHAEGITKQESKDGSRPSEAEVLSKAQRIVLELNSDNTKRAVEGNEYVLVLGYAPWCMRSAELMPKFAEAATSLKELGSPVLLAKLDAENYPKAASSLGIKGFPTLLLFVNGTSQPYTGGFSAEEIVIWVRKKTGAPVIRMTSVNDANEFLKKHSIFAVGLFDKFEGPKYEEFLKAARFDNEFQFVETSTIEVAKILFPDIKPSTAFFGLVKSEPVKYTAFGDKFNADEILQFLDNNKFPLVTVLTELNSAKVYSSTNKMQVLIFTERDDFRRLLEPLQDVAKKFTSKIMLVLADIKDENLAKPFLTLFGLEDSEDVAVTAFNYSSNFKYLLESEPTPKHIEEFCLGLLHGTLSPYYKSQPIPDNKDADILTIVGKTFDDLVLKSPKNILLEVHTPWCINCESTSKQVAKLAKHFKGLETLVFARIDASLNEHPKLQVDDYPELLFYPAHDKSNPVKLPTKSSSKEFAALINKSLKAQDQTDKDEL